MTSGTAAATHVLHAGPGQIGRWHRPQGAARDWSLQADGAALVVDVPDGDAGSYLVSEPVPALEGNYRVSARLKLAEPDRGALTYSADLVLNAVDLDTCYLLRLRVRNGVRYLTLVKRSAGVSEQLADDIQGFDFDRWLDVEVSFVDGRFEVRLDGQTVASCAEFDRLAGGSVGVGAQGATATFGAVDLFDLGADRLATSATSSLSPEATVPSRPAGPEGARSVRAVLENESYRVDFVELTSIGGVSYRTEISVRDGDGWLCVGQDEQWVVLSGDGGSRRNLYASTDAHWVRFHELESLDDTVRLRAAEPGRFDLTATWSLAGATPRVELAFVPSTDGRFVVGYQAFAGRTLEQVDEVLCGPLQHARMVGGPESLGTSELTAPMCLVQYAERDAPVTIGLFIPPHELPFEHEPSKGDDRQLFGMSLRNDRGEVQPVLFAPQYGEHAAMAAGAEYRFDVGLYAARTELFEAYRELLRTVYGYRAYRRNVFGASLTDTVHNLVDLMKAGPDADDSVEYRPSPSGWWSRAKGFIDIENDQAVRATTTSVLLSAYYLTGDDELYERRARPTIEFHLSRNGYGWTPRDDRTVYGDPTKHEVCAVPFGAPALAPLHPMTRGAMPVVRHLALDRLDTEDYWLKRAPMSTPLAAYRLNGDPELLRRAEELARGYIEQPYPDSVDAHDFQNYYVKAWVELLEMYQETGDKAYLDAAYREARRYVTQVFVRPVPDGTAAVPSRPMFVDRQIEMTGWWGRKALFDYPSTDVPDEEVERWLISPNGMSFEALKTYRYNGYTNNPAWAPSLLRLASHTGDDLLRDIAHNAVVGRYTNYPGYYFRQFTVHHMKPRFPYEGPFGNTTIYHHHAPAQLGMTIDYLLTEHRNRSDGNVAFPSEFEQNYVWFAYRVYGHRPGRFYGHDGAWLWMPRGLVSTGNEQVNWIAAEGGDRLFVSLTNESDDVEPVRLRVDPARVPMEPGRPYRATVIHDNGAPGDAWMTDHALDTTVSPLGITAVVIHDVGPFDLPLHTVPPEPTAPERSYHLADATPVGPVWGMLLTKPDGSRYDAFVQAATREPATLCYSTDGGATFHRIERDIVPNEWTVPVDDLTATFTYYVEAGGERTDPVDLTASG